MTKSTQTYRLTPTNKMRTKPKIHLMTNNLIQDEICAVTGKEFTADWPFSFVLKKGDKILPVSVEAALENGFTMSRVDFEDLHFLAGQAIHAELESRIVYDNRHRHSFP